MKKTLLLILVNSLLLSVLTGTDITERLEASLAFQRKTYLAGKVPGKFPPCLTSDGRFKLTNTGDLFSAMMDTWGLKLLQGNTAEEVIALLPSIDAWAGEKQPVFENILKGLEGILADLKKEGVPSFKKLDGELRFGLALASQKQPKELEGALLRLIDMNRWMLLECVWLKQVCALIRTHTGQFTSDWSKARLNGVVFGASLSQRIYDIAEIQVLFEDIIQFDKSELELLKKFTEVPAVLAPHAREGFSVLAQNISPDMKTRLYTITETDYEVSFLNTQFLRYDSCTEGADFCAKALAHAVSLYEKRTVKPVDRHLADLINYRQGTLFAGYEPGSRFDPAVLGVYTPIDDEPLMKAAAGAFSGTRDYFKTELSWGASLDIRDSLTKKKADEWRLSNLAAASLSARGYRGIYPVGIKGYGILGVFDDVRIRCGDPFRGTAPAPFFPEYYTNNKINSVSLYLRTIGGWIAYKTLVNSETGVVRIEIPYLK